MEQILTVRELIMKLMEFNMDALVFVNSENEFIGITSSAICWNNETDNDDKVNSKKMAQDVIFDISSIEKELHSTK